MVNYPSNTSSSTYPTFSSSTETPSIFPSGLYTERVVSILPTNDVIRKEIIVYAKVIIAYSVNFFIRRVAYNFTDKHHYYEHALKTAIAKVFDDMVSDKTLLMPDADNRYIRLNEMTDYPTLRKDYQ